MASRSITRRAWCARIRSARACSTPAPSSARSCRSTTAGAWQPLQQNLPATPVTDIKVHRNDLVISTMGRRPVDHGRRHAAAAAGGDVRAGGADHDGRPRAAARAACRRWPSARRRDRGGGCPRRCPAAYLFQPQDAVRNRYVPTPPSAAEPEYLDPRAAFRSLLRQRAHRRDARGERRQGRDHSVVRRRRRRAAPAPGRRCAGRSAASAARRPSRRAPACSASRGTCAIPGPWAANAPSGGAGGPMAAPGSYSVTLTAGGQSPDAHVRAHSSIRG